jgi:glycosyltransferase involved in cell wall biosynthesis
VRVLILPGYRYPASLNEPLICGDLRNSFNLSRALARAGETVTVLSRQAPGDPALQTFDGVVVKRYRPELGSVFPTSFDISRRRARLFGDQARISDVVVASTPLSLELLTPKRAPMVYICSGLEDIKNYGASARESLQGLGIRLLRDPARRRSWARSDRVNTTAELEATTLLRLGVPRERILTIGPGVEAERYTPAGPTEVAEFRRSVFPPEARDKRIVLSVSRFTPAKGLLETLSAFARLRARRADVFLALVGVRHSHRSDYFDRMRRAIVAMSLEQDVAILENLPERQLPVCYSAADVTSVFSVGYDPLPTTIIESMACGTPVVAADFAPRVQMITHNLNGVLVPEREEATWMAAVNRILSDHIHASHLRDAGLHRVRDQFDMNRVAQRYLEAFRRL